MNWQNINSDPTWVSVDNWYWRSWEVCIGVVASCIPALRPACRAITSGSKSYLSHRSLRRSSSGALVEPGEPSKSALCFARLFKPRQASHDSAIEAARHTVSVEAGRAQAYGAGEDGFPMKNLAGDKKMTTQGIQKTTRIDVEERSAQDSQKSFDPQYFQGGERGRYFV